MPALTFEAKNAIIPASFRWGGMPLNGKRGDNMAKYLDPKADVTFKKVFGEHKNLVISLLNALLPLDDRERRCSA